MDKVLFFNVRDDDCHTGSCKCFLVEARLHGETSAEKPESLESMRERKIAGGLHDAHQRNWRDRSQLVEHKVRGVRRQQSEIGARSRESRNALQKIFDEAPPVGSACEHQETIYIDAVDEQRWVAIVPRSLAKPGNKQPIILDGRLGSDTADDPESPHAHHVYDDSECGSNAVASISIEAPRGSPDTAIVVRAGGSAPKHRA